MDSSLSPTRCSTATQASEARGKSGTRMHDSQRMRTAALRTCHAQNMQIETLMSSCSRMLTVDTGIGGKVPRTMQRPVQEVDICLTEVDVSREAVTKVSK